MDCEDKARLLKVYQSATARFSTAVTLLHARMPVSAAAEYERMKTATEEARLESERARVTLERHTATHGC